MCGRFTLRTPTAAVVEQFSVPGESRQLPLRFNIAPTQEVAVVRQPQGSREIALLHWGLVPFCATDKKVGNRMINARAESVADKPAFRAAFKKRRCLVVAHGYYEWRKAEGAKTALPVGIMPAPCPYNNISPTASPHMVMAFTVPLMDASRFLKGIIVG